MRKIIFLLAILFVLGQCGFVFATAEQGDLLWIKMGDPDDDGDGDGLPDWALNSGYNDSGFRSSISTGDRVAIITKVSNTGPVSIDGRIWFHSIFNNCGLGPDNFVVLETNNTTVLTEFSAFRETTDGTSKIAGFGANPPAWPNLPNWSSFVLLPTESAYHVEFITIPSKACPGTWKFSRTYDTIAGVRLGDSPWPLPSFALTNPSGQYIAYLNELIVRDGLGIEVAPPFGIGTLTLLNYENYEMDYKITNTGTSAESTDMYLVVNDEAGHLCSKGNIVVENVGSVSGGQTVTRTGTYPPNGEGRVDCQSSSSIYFYTATRAGTQGIIAPSWFIFTISGPSIKIESTYPEQYFADEQAQIHVGIENDGDQDFPPGKMLTIKLESFTPSSSSEYIGQVDIAAPAHGAVAETTFNVNLEVDSFGQHSLIVEIFDGAVRLDNIATSFTYPHRLVLAPTSLSGNLNSTETAVLTIRNDYHTVKTVDLSSNKPGWIIFDDGVNPPAQSLSGLTIPGTTTVTIDIQSTAVCPAVASQNIAIQSAVDLMDSIDLSVQVNNWNYCLAPVADAGLPYEITLPATQVILDGSNSFDNPECMDGSCLTYVWTIGAVTNTANCSVTAGAGTQTPTVDCTANGTADVSLIVTDGVGISSPVSNTTITVNPEPLPGAEPSIKSLKAGIIHDGGNGTVDVEVKNAEAGTTIELKFLNTATGAELASPAGVSGQNISMGTFSSSFGPFNESGNFWVVVKIDSGSCGICEKKTLLTVLPASESLSIVPEINPLLVVAIALSVLLIVQRR